MRAAIYSRKSDDNAASAERQVEIARKFATEHGWTVDPAHVYVDNDVSGAKFTRPGLDALLAAIEERPLPFDVLLMMDHSRLGRKMEKVLPLQIRITRKVRVFHYQDGNELKLNTATQKLTSSVNNYAAEDYRDQIKSKTRDALREMAANGEVTGGAPFGYRLIDSGQRRSKHGKQVVVKRREIDPVQAQAVVRIFELAAEGYGALKLAGQLRTERIVAPSADGWTASGVKKILANELYHGVFTYGRTTWETREVINAETGEREDKEYKVPVPRGQWIECACPADRIVSEELWQAAQARIAETRDAYLVSHAGRLDSKPDAGRDSKFLLSGFLKCGACGSNVIVIENGRSYQCSKRHRLGTEACSMKRIGREAADHGVIEMLYKEVLTPEAVAAIAKRTAELKVAEPSTLEQERAVVAAEITRLEGARQRLLDLLETGDDPGGVRTRLTERTRDLNAARARAEHLEGQAISDRWVDPVYLAKLQAAIEERRVYLSGHPDRKEPLPVAALRSLLRKLLDVIIIERTEDGIGVRFNCVLADSAWIEEKASGSANGRLTTSSSGERAE